MQRRLLIAAGSIVAILALFFFFRLTYGYLTTSSRSGQVHAGCRAPRYKLANYASAKLVRRGGKRVFAQKAGRVTHDQKYEKVATLTASTTVFKRDEGKVRALVKQNNALIQYEHRSGLTGRRCLHLAIGVPPARFEEMLAAIQKVGTLRSLKVTKKDKTNEYKQLQAERKSLQTARSSLLRLKGRSGKVAEFLKLEDRILSIEKKIQGFGVSLGDFDQENEFVTIKATLAESGASGVSFVHRVKVALEWTIQYGLLLFFLLACAAVSAFVAWKLWDRLVLFWRRAEERS